MQVLNLLISFILCFLMVPLNRKLSIKLGVVAVPRKRDAHTKPTPRMGGLSIVVSFIISVLIFMFFTPEINVKKILFILAGVVVLGIVGVLDDAYDIKPWQKLLGQLLAIILAICGGVNVRFLVWDTPGMFATFIKMLNIFGTIFWTLGMINAINLIDGLDGLSSGISLIASISFMVIAVTNGNTVAMLLAVSLAGATLGFLAHNFHPANIFMGDTGSMLLGYVLAIVALETGFEYLDVVCFFAPLIILAIPIFDTAFAILRRIVNHMPISEADKNHTHHILFRKFSHRKTVIILYLFGIAFGATGIIISRTQSRYYMLLALVILLVLIALLVEDKDKKIKVEETSSKEDTLNEEAKIENTEKIKKENSNTKSIANKKTKK